MARSSNELSAEQKECLRLVLLHYDSKQIARQVGVSPHTVNKRIEAAMRRLGASDRVSAARMFAEMEHGADYERFVYEQFAMEIGAAPDALPVRSHNSADDLLVSHLVAHDAARPASFADRQDERDAIVRLGMGGLRNDLTASERLKLIGLYAIGIIAMIALLTSVTDALFRILSRVFGTS